MLINIDFKSLEVICAADLSGDKVLSKEITDGADIHANNMATFKLPSRLIAKVLVFRILYGGNEFSFAQDPDFMSVSTSEKYWKGAIDAFYEKYQGIASWHRKIIQEAQRNRRLEIPSGRYYPFEPEIKYGKVKWPITKIKNYVVQGWGSDLVMLARLEAKKRLKGLPVDLVSTIHDSIVADCESRYLDEVAPILLASVQAVPQLCREKFNYDFTLPITGEVSYGPNKRDLVDYRFN